MAKIIGIREVSFVAKDGKHIKGKTIYTTERIPEKEGSGESAKYFFLHSDKISKLKFSLCLNLEVEVLYNQYGRVYDLRLLDEPIDLE